MKYDPIQTTVNSLVIDEEFLFVGMGDYRVEIWDWKHHTHVGSITQDLWEVRSIAIDEKYIYVGSLNEHVNIYNKNGFELIEQLHHTQGITHLHLDSEYLYTCGYNDEVAVWDKSDFSLKASLKGHLTRSVACTSSSDEIITGDGFMGEGAVIRVWSKSDFLLRTQISDPQSKRIHTLFLTETRLYSTHGGPGEIRIWDRINNYELITRFTSDYGDFIDVHVDDKFIYGLSRDKLYIWDQLSHQLMKILDENGKNIMCISSQSGILFYGAHDSIIMRDLMKSDFPIIHTINP